MMFKSAGPGEIVRSHQKDEYYLSYLRGLITDVMHQLVGPRVWICWRKEIDICADLGYFFLTTFSGYQTVGEEYVNIIQVDGTRRRVPSTLRRGMMVLLYVLTPYLLRHFFEWLDNTLRSPDTQEIPIETREFLLKNIPVAKTVVLYCHRLHMALFYLQGLFYQISKRVLGINYVVNGIDTPKEKLAEVAEYELEEYVTVSYVRDTTDGMIQQDLGFGQEGDSVAHSFKVLGWITLAQLLGSCSLGVYTFLKDKSKYGSFSLLQPDNSDFVSADRKCSLCLEKRKHSSVTPCGHLFCWSCIHDWCLTKAECPLCREKFEQHRIVPLQNFDPH